MVASKKLIISYTGGTGGYWLRRTINGSQISNSSKSFHEPQRPRDTLKVIHELDPNKFDYLFTGKYYFNFYANMLYKRFYDIDRPNSYEDFLLTCVSTGRFVCEFDSIKEHAYFEFDDLINNPSIFHSCITKVQTKYNYPVTELSDFECNRQTFIKTCVNTQHIYENFDSMAWVCFVLGQLSLHNIQPQDFSINDINNQDRCRQFAFDNYRHCRLIDTCEFDTSIQLPAEFYSS